MASILDEYVPSDIRESWSENVTVQGYVHRETHVPVTVWKTHCEICGTHLRTTVRKLSTADFLPGKIIDSEKHRDDCACDDYV